MSIKLELRSLVEKEVLWCLEPFDGDPAVRTILVSSRLNALFSGAARDSRIGQLWSSLIGIVAGGEVTMSFVPFKHKGSTFGLLDPKKEGTWEFRSIAPAPGLRIFGRFVDVDTFVAVDWWPRSKPLEGFDKVPLGDRHSLSYQFAQISVDKFWKTFLPERTPILGENCNDYFTAKCTDVGAKW